ncbi:MAG: lysophospholipid acyltransferase family protein [Planctomycetota bacterium]|nr:lysophospholipid acyltransferase family protein [Planctomycetota bacterium]
MSPTVWLILALVVAGWFLFWTFAVPAVRRRVAGRLENRIGESPEAGFLDLVNAFYVRWFHRVRFVGFEALPSPFREGDSGPGIVIANHSAGVDPLLVQAGIRRFIRWMMWAEMETATPSLAFVWRTGRILPVKYGAEDSTIVRRAVRHLKGGGLLGLFPEGAIARPPREIRPFQPGIGLIARLSKAPVLVLHIHDTPYAPTAMGAVWRRSHSVVEVVGIYDLSSEKDPIEATERLREALIHHAGWPPNEAPILEHLKPAEPPVPDE